MEPVGSLQRLHRGFERLLEAVVVLLMIALALIVIAGVGFRKMDMALAWYDEVASIALAWLTYYGAALAALKGAHIGFPGLVSAVPAGWRMVLFVIAEAAVIGFFLLLAWLGLEVLEVLEGDGLVSLPGISLQLTQSAIPIGSLLFVVAEVLHMPAAWRSLQAGQAAQAEHVQAIPQQTGPGR